MIELVRLCAEHLDLESSKKTKDPKRLQGLRRLFAEPPPQGGDSKRAYSRAETDMLVELVLPDREIRARLVDIGGGGMKVMLRGQLGEVSGEIVVVASDRERGIDYRFPCEIAWIEDSWAGLHFAGVPIQSRRAGADESEPIAHPRKPIPEVSPPPKPVK